MGACTMITRKQHRLNFLTVLAIRLFMHNGVALDDSRAASRKVVPRTSLVVHQARFD